MRIATSARGTTRTCLRVACARLAYIYGGVGYRRNERRSGAKREWKHNEICTSGPQGSEHTGAREGWKGGMDSARNTEARSPTPHAVTLDASATRRSTMSATASRCPPPGQSEATPTWGHHTWPHGLFDRLREPDVRSAQSYWPLADRKSPGITHARRKLSEERPSGGSLHDTSTTMATEQFYFFVQSHFRSARAFRNCKISELLF